MRSFLLGLAILFSLAFVFDGVAFAEKYEIIIPSGASDPGAPFFWSEKSTGVTTGIITVHPGDTVEWHNADTAFHTVTTVTEESYKSGEFVEDGVIDSGFFTAGKSFTQKFDELGDFYYYCIIHPYMFGIVHVVEDSGSVQSIDGVGSGYTEDGLGFEVKYILDTNLQRAVHINPDESTVTFTISGDTLNDQITLVLPSELIENPNAVWVDGTMTDFETEETSSGLKLIIPIEPHAKQIKIMGTHVIPEFGFLAVGILSVGLISSVFLIRSRLSIF
ncbi:plastocyanin/azurin family copper-binding protein [Nitrosopumilus sp.]|uniref:cupredoxin domain-containing protein n=1 Tax=Nitrosopumilus sp. TaxID=2024843 RepID=UPI0026340FB8|nr:plastocyanin/azurin family copper-binding protein [Nitrosopumilus sp.]